MMHKKTFKHPHGGLCFLCGSSVLRKVQKKSKGWSNLRQDEPGAPFFDSNRCLGLDPIHADYITAMGQGMAENEAAQGTLFAHADCCVKKNQAYQRASTLNKEPSAPPVSDPSASGVALEWTDPTNLFSSPLVTLSQPKQLDRGAIDIMVRHQQNADLQENADLQAIQPLAEKKLDSCRDPVAQLEQDVDQCSVQRKEIVADAARSKEEHEARAEATLWREIRKEATRDNLPAWVALVSDGNRPGVQEEAAKALEYLAVDNPEFQRKAAAAGAIPPLMAMLSSTSTSARLKYQAAKTLAVLAKMIPDNLRKIAVASVILPLVALLSASTPAHLLVSAATALGRIAMYNPDSQRKVAAAGAMPPLLKLLSASTPSIVQAQAARTIGLLATGNPDNIRKVAAAGAMPRLSSLLSCSDTDLEVQKVARHLSLVLESGRRSEAMKAEASDKLAQELVAEEEMEKAAKGAKSKTKKDKKMRQIEKKKKEGGSAAAAVVEEEEEDYDLCVVCIDRDPDVRLQPCGHMSMCYRCCEAVLAKKRECPMCRTKVEGHVRLKV